MSENPRGSVQVEGERLSTGLPGASQGPPSIIDAMRSKMFGSFFGPSWRAWTVFLSAVYGLPIAAGPDLDLFRRATGLQDPPSEAASEVFCVSGRRSGKSRIAALLGVWAACFKDWRSILGPGERGKVLILAVDRAQARGVRDYIGGLLNSSKLRSLVKAEFKESISLKDIDIEVATANYRSIRGRTVVCGILEELAFWQPSENSSNPAKEVYVALKPAIQTVPGGVLIGISSAYARQGLLWEQVERYRGRPGSTLVWVSDSRTMNPSLSQAMIDKEIEADPSAGRAEWLSVFRDDVESFIGLDLLRSAIVPGRVADVPLGHKAKAVGFIDPSGGRQDSYTAAVASRDRTGRIIVHAMREVKPPFSPEATTEAFAKFFKSYGVSSVVSDRWGGEWVHEMWRKHSITVKTSEATSSDLYLSFLALMTSGKVELPDSPRLVSQILQLERRVRPGGKDQVTHPAGAGFHDDLANAVAGACVEASRRTTGRVCAVAGGDVYPGPRDYGNPPPLTYEQWSEMTRFKK